MKLTTAHKNAVGLAKRNDKNQSGKLYDHKAEAHLLTDKDEYKVVPCRTCKRPCIVNRFAAPAKVACLEHRERTVDVEGLREFDRSLEVHVLTDKDKTKECPCTTCGRPCVVNVFAAPAKVRCKDHGGAEHRPRKTTQIVKNGDRFQEVTTMEVVDTKERVWADWALYTPMDIERDWTEADLKQRDAAKDQRNEANRKLALLKAERRDIEAKPPTAKTDAALSQVEDTIQALESKVAGLTEVIHTVGRIAWLRAALKANYRVEDGVLRRGQFELQMPDDYLDADTLAELIS